MKRMLLAAMLVAASSQAGAAFDLEDWTWEAAIDADAAPGFARLVIGPEILDKSRPDLHDVRLLDDRGELAPYVLHWGRERGHVEEVWRSARYLNRTYQPSEYMRVTADFGEAVEKNRLKVQCSGANFRRRVLLEGSEDGREWAIVLEDAWLFDVSLEGRQFRVDTIEFPSNNFRFLRLTVFNMEDDPRRIEIGSVQAALRHVLAEAELVEAPVQGAASRRDKELKKSVYEFDLGYRNLPVAALELAVEEPYFYRAYEIRGRNAAMEQVKRRTETGWDEVEQEAPWTTVRCGVFYRIQGGTKVSESLRIDGLDVRYRFLQLTLSDEDNPPLTVDLERVKVLRREVSLVFDVKPGGRYRLVTGNPLASAPRFDLARSVTQVDDSGQPMLTPGPLTPLDTEPETPPWSESHQVFMWLALAAGVGVMLVLILFNLGKLKDVDGASNHPD